MAHADRPPDATPGNVWPGALPGALLFWIRPAILERISLPSTLLIS